MGKYSRPPLGLPYGIHTKSGPPLSDDFASRIQSSPAQYVVTAKVTHTEPYDTRAVLVARLTDFATPKSILITLNDWKTDSYVGILVSLHYSVTLEVIDSLGESLATATRAGVKPVPSAYPLSQAVTDIFGELFNEESVKRHPERAKKGLL